MKKFKKIGLGLLFVIFCAASFGMKASAATPPKPQNFQSDPSALFNTKFLYKNNQIQATITDISAPNEPTYDLTFTQNSKNKLEYDTTQNLFCASNVQIVAAPAKITLSKAPSGSSFQGNLSAYVWVQAGSACKTYNTSKTITNQDTTSGGTVSQPSTITYNGGTYTQLANTDLYGLNKQKGTDCYGGSVILTNDKGTNGTAYLGLQVAVGSANALAPILQKAGGGSDVQRLILDCAFQDPTANTAGYSGSITNGKLNAATPNTNTSSADRPACAFDTNSNNWDAAESWILCPVINGLSVSADAINGIIVSQLNFDVNSNLTGSVQKAWTIFKDLASAILVVLMLIMVLSQAIGGGIFDAYTVRKMLPKLAAAVILMQISWYLCIYLITLANDAGHGIAGLISVPFGGTGALDLPQLLSRLNILAGSVIGLAATGGAITALIFSGAILSFGWPVLLLGVILIALSELVFMLSLLCRTAFIVLLVILSPLAFLAFVLPGTEKYWKYWRDNLLKMLLLFPLIMLIIYGGRIFAWTAGNLGAAGPLDTIMLLAGFFGPYFIVPKSFKWGGSLLSMAYRNINESAPFKKGREVAGRELVNGEDSAMKRRMNFYASEYTQKDSLGNRVKNSLLSGRVIPTRRAMNSMIARGNAYKGRENELEKALQERDREKVAARTDDVSAGKRMDMEAISNASAKAAEAHAKGDTYSQKRWERVAKEAMRDLVATGSTLEMDTMTIKDTDGKQKFVYQTRMWRDLLNGSPDLYRQVKKDAPDWVPHRTPYGLPKFRGEGTSAEARMMADVIQTAKTVSASDPSIARQFPNLEEDVQEAQSRWTTVTELDIRAMAELHPTYFERIGRQGERGQALLDKWKAGGEVDDNLKKLGEQLLKPAQAFGEFVQKAAATQGGREALEHMMGGTDTMEHLDYGLQFSGIPGAEIAKRKGEGSLENILRIGEAEQIQRQQALASGGAPAAQQPAQQAQQAAPASAQSRAAPAATAQPVFATGVSSRPGNVTFNTVAAQPSAPIEVKIDHNALADTIREASRAGTKLGMNQALRESGLHRGGPTGGAENDEDDNRGTPPMGTP